MSKRKTKPNRAYLTEDDVQDEVLAILDEAPDCLAIRLTNVTGMPDIIACIRGRFTGIEVKYDKDGSYRVTKGQKLRMRAIERAGGTSLVVDKNNIEDFRSYVNDRLESNEVSKFEIVQGAELR